MSYDDETFGMTNNEDREIKKINQEGYQRVISDKPEEGQVVLSEEGKVMVGGEVFFADPTAEYNYFQSRMNAIENYQYYELIRMAKEALITRYIKAIASLSDDPECDAIRDVYVDCLSQLGVDDYSLDTEIANYRMLHPDMEKNILVSNTGRSLH